MTWVIALIVGGILAATVYEQIQKPKRLKAAQERDEQRRTRARLNGWNFEVERATNTLIYRYSGVTGGIAWTFETSSWTSRSRGGQRTQNTSRWWTSDAAAAPNAILAIWPSFGEADRIGPQVPQFVMNLILTPLIRSLRADSEDAALLSQAVPVAVDDRQISRHYLLRATDPAAMQRFLADGAREVLADAGPWLTARSQPNHLVIAAFTRSSFTMLFSNFVDDPELIGKIVKTGAALASAYRK